MLKSFLADKYVELISEYVNRFGGHNIIEEDIAVTKCFFIFLHIFYDETCTLFAVYAPTSYLALHSVAKIAKHLYLYQNFTIFQQYVQAMRTKISKYWSISKIPYLYGFTCILDPRMKFGGYLIFLQNLKRSTREDYVAHDHTRVVEEFYSFFRFYQRQIPIPLEPSPPDTH